MNAFTFGLLGGLAGIAVVYGFRVWQGLRIKARIRYLEKEQRITEEQVHNLLHGGSTYKKNGPPTSSHFLSGTDCSDTDVGL